jgi:2'-5' RNA ligase
MALAINIRADHVSADAIERLWDEVAAFEDAPSMCVLGYRPHLTFAIYDDVDEETACEAMQRATIGQTRLRVAFSRIRWFEGPPLVLWTEPSRIEALARMHASISAAIEPARCRPHYRPETWTPHCTLGMCIANRRRSDAIAFAQSFDRSIDVLFDVMDCVAFPPVRVTAERKLPPA